jgi:hypothetical protein
MAKVTFRNVLDEESEFREVQSTKLIDAVYEYARLCDKDIYDSIMKEKISIVLNLIPVHVDEWSLTTVDDEDEIIIYPDIGAMAGIGALLIAGGKMMATYTTSPVINDGTGALYDQTPKPIKIPATTQSIIP